MPAIFSRLPFPVTVVVRYVCVCMLGACAYVRALGAGAYVRMCVCAYVRRYAMPNTRTLLSNLLPVTVVARPAQVRARGY